MAGTLLLVSPPPTQNPRFLKHRKPSEPNPIDLLLHYLRAISHGWLPTKAAFISAMRASSLLPSTSHGRTVHGHILKAGLGADRFVASSVVAFYSSCSPLATACQVFDRIPARDTALETAMLVGYVRNGEITDARKLFDQMTKRDVIAWNAMLNTCAQCGFPEDALELFREMQISEYAPNAVTLIGALSACSQIGCLELGEWIHCYIHKHSEVNRTTTLSNCLVHMYAKCGRVDRALELFLENSFWNLESWNTMLTGFAINGCGASALSLFAQMIKLGLQPDRITFVGLLMACSHSGMIEDARRSFTCMLRVYGIEPDIEHYGCMVDTLSRRGYLDEARLLIRDMPFEANACAWGALLRGCFAYGNFELGLKVAGHLVEMEPFDESRYVALMNLYASIGSPADALRLRMVVDEMGIKQSSGRSMIEVDGVLHEFSAGGR